MLRARSDRLRVTLLTSLGLLPVACGAQVDSGRAGELDGSLSTPSESQTSAPDVSSPVEPPNKEPVLPPEACEGSTASDTGLVNCANGVVHRPTPVECPNRTSQAIDAELAVLCDADENCINTSSCRTDADCGAPYGKWKCTILGSQGLAFRCEVACATDADCNADEACVCGPLMGECLKASCRSADDCGDGYLCAAFHDLSGNSCGEPMQLACQTPADECRTSDQCSSDGRYGNCSAASGTWRCADVPGIACGRPFLVDGQARLAPVTAGCDDGAVLSPCLEGLDDAGRDRLARAWLEIGRMEHASIAAFARFSLQLLELGAPHALLVAAQAAMADETEHTRLAFALASHYAGERLGPGKLPMDGALRESRLEDVLSLVLREGCIGETIAALEAAEALAHTEDPIVRSVLERIARDEQAHAELAWRFVAWALGERPELASLVERELTLEAHALRLHAGEAPPARASQRGGAFDPLPYGILSDAGRAAVRAAAWSDVVRPCASGLLAQS